MDPKDVKPNDEGFADFLNRFGQFGGKLSEAAKVLGDKLNVDKKGTPLGNIKDEIVNSEDLNADDFVDAEENLPQLPGPDDKGENIPKLKGPDDKGDNIPQLKGPS